ncbi:hypothetical protein KSF_009430 [Reticulibacter mediterranei]|uniref:CHRD domain-containing protein n=1 Tax=Reticulibacter mediterranei TaxID=2778369 RepID=A0A8J3N057_9CHLR|nr:hypothetical protein [Reticulibacter mediterranei]GHO90895.1 hypothetical protein KSF_009430 [Reticulibacter mediterranei]
MRNSGASDFYCVRAWLIRVSIAIVMSCLLFALMSLPIFAHTQNKQDVRSQTIASVQKAPPGKADLKWDARKQELTVMLDVNGLQPGSDHTSHIHAGTCSSMGKILYPLRDIVANKDGHGVATTVIKGVKGGIAATGWSIAVHKGAVTTSAILCGNGANPKKATSVTVPLSAPPMK